jgi:hypothetical protein
MQHAAARIACQGGHLFFFLFMSSHRRFFGPRFIAQMLGLCGPRKGMAAAGAPGD